MKKKTFIKKTIPVSALVLALAFGSIGIAGCSGETEVQAEVTATEANTDSTSGADSKESLSDDSGQPGTPPDGAGSGSGQPGNPPDGAGGGSGQPGNPPDGGNGGPGGGSSSVSWTAATTISDSKTYSGTSYTSSTSGENALMVSGSGITPTLTRIKVSKTGDGSNGDNSSFYGINSAIIAKDGANVTIKNATITTDSEGANGVFSYGGNGGKNGATGDGTTVNISDSTITTTQGGSGGIMTTGGGVTNASNLTVTTSGRSSAAIRTDRGGGTVNVDGGTYTTNGLGSPAIYSTASISVKNATLVSNKSEGVCIEGTNSIELTDCDLTANNTEKNGNAQYLDTIMIYQSMSGDADGTDSSFTMTGGTLNSKSGHVFHVTNTSAQIKLNGVTINNTDSEGVLLSVVNDGWSGAANTATVNATSQNLEGRIIVSNTASSKSSSKSTLTLNLDSNSAFIGSIGDENGTGSSLGTVDVTVNGGWKLTADSYVTSISGSGRIDYNGHTLYVNGVAYTSGTPGGSITEGTVIRNTSTGNDSTGNTGDSGSGTSTGDVTVGTASVSNVSRSKNGKKMTVAITAVTGADGYEIQYSTSKSFSGKSTKIVRTSSLKKKIKSLKKSKTYYVRVRAYKAVNGTRTYGEWSEPDTVRSCEAARNTVSTPTGFGSENLS
ncbi:MAG: hypothetical protein J5819_00365 [Eubacterium sp.]|nr:hypothetical protein [Eubacterium sp.]